LRMAGGWVNWKGPDFGCFATLTLALSERERACFEPAFWLFSILLFSLEIFGPEAPRAR
jgi:hypothetical protein